MHYALEEIGNALKEARRRRGLSQRGLSELAAVPQAQISKIENGNVDLKVSTLLKLARTLELEPVLAPRKSLAAVNSIIRSAAPGQPGSKGPSRSEWARLFTQAREKLSRDLERTDYAQLGRTLRELEHLSPSLEQTSWRRIDLKRFRDWLRTVDDGPQTLQLLNMLRNLRIQAAHGAASSEPADEVRPAYRLDEDRDA